MKHTKNEFEEIKKKYNFEEVNCIGMINAIELSKVIQKAKSFEEPDAYSIVGDTAYIIEHFEFDSYINNKKGSKYKIEIAENERELKEAIVNDEGMISGVVQSNSSFKNYIDNFIKHLNYHYERIDNYKNNLLKIYPKIKEFKVWFFAEDTDDFAPMIYNSDIFCCVHPLNFSRTLNNLNDKTKIDGIVIGACFGDNTYHTLFVKREYFNMSAVFDEGEDIVGTNPHYVMSQYIINK